MYPDHLHISVLESLQIHILIYVKHENARERKTLQQRCNDPQRLALGFPFKTSRFQAPLIQNFVQAHAGGGQGSSTLLSTVKLLQITMFIQVKLSNVMKNFYLLIYFYSPI